MLGRRIRNLRMARGLTQQELGEIASVNYKYIGDIENAKRNPSFDCLASISAAFGLSLTELFDFEHENPNPEELRKSTINMLSEFDQETIRTVFKLISAFRK